MQIMLVNNLTSYIAERALVCRWLVLHCLVRMMHAIDSPIVGMDVNACISTISFLDLNVLLLLLYLINLGLRVLFFD